MYTIPRHIRAVIFDHDGTLVDSEPLHLLCWQRLLGEYGPLLTSETYKHNLMGIPSIESAKWIVSRFNLPHTPNALLKRKLTLLAELRIENPPPLCNGVLHLLSRIQRRGVQIGLASGASRPEVDHSLQHHAITSCFEAICTNEDVVRNKPAPDIYQLACRRLGVAPTQCLAIEDSATGQQSAIAAGLLCVRLAEDSAPSRAEVGSLAQIDFSSGSD